MSSPSPQPQPSPSMPRTSSEGSIATLAPSPESSLQPKLKKVRRSSSSEQSTLCGFVIKTTKTEKEKLDQQIANRINATNTPFRAVEHPEYKKAVHMLRPGYDPPNRKQVGGELLDKLII